MSKSTLQIILFGLSGFYTLGGLVYIYYHASNVAERIYKETNTDVFFSSINNPFWRWSPEMRRVINLDLEFSRYVDRVERAKYIFILGGFVVFGINVLVANFL